MGKPFSEMTEAERLVNRALLRAGLSANWTEQGTPEMITDQKVRLAIDHAATSAMHHVRAYTDACRAVAGAVPGLAMDSAKSADDVYRMALDHVGVDTQGVPTSAYKPLFDMVRRGQYVPSRKRTEASRKDLAAIAPGIARIRKG